MCIRPRWTDVFVHVPQIALGIAFDLPGISVKAQRRFGKRNRLRLDSRRIWRLIEENLIPVNVEIGSDTNARCSRRRLACEFCDNRSREAGRETDIVADALPFACWRLHVEKWDHRFDACLVRSKTRSCAEVLDISLHDHSQGTGVVRAGELE